MAANRRYYQQHLSDRSHIAIMAEADGVDAGCGAICLAEQHPSPDRSYDKAKPLIEAGCAFSDFGTRRRASFRAQETVIKAMKACQESMSGPGTFIGTSNVYFAMKYDLVTMAHELICAIAGMYGPRMAKIRVPEWSNNVSILAKSVYRRCIHTDLTAEMTSFLPMLTYFAAKLDKTNQHETDSILHHGGILYMDCRLCKCENLGQSRDGI